MQDIIQDIMYNFNNSLQVTEIFLHITEIGQRQQQLHYLSE